MVRVLLISSVLPETLGMGGSLILQRYLFDTPGVACEVLPPPQRSLRSRLYRKLHRLGF